MSLNTEIVTANPPEAILDMKPKKRESPQLMLKEKNNTKINEELEKRRQEERQPVRGIFRYYELPSGMLEFNFRKFPGDPVEKYRLFDGRIYTLPKMVAMHLNSGCWYPIHKEAIDENGNSIAIIGEKRFRVGFQSLEFVDVGEFQQSNQIVSGRFKE